MFTVYLALFGWIPLTFLFFGVLPPRNAVLACFLGGWMFLPIAGLPISGLPDYTKVSAIALSAVVAALVMDGGRFRGLRLRWFDLPLLVWCLWPVPSALAAGLGVHAGLSAALDQVIVWGVPYLLGRAYFTVDTHLQEILFATCAAGVIYIPFCLYELRFSPQLHYQVYGFAQHVWAQTHRAGGWRPQVFMEHGLALGMFMASAALAGFALWRSRTKRRVLFMSTGLCALLLLLTTILCKSMGSIVLLFVGMGLVFMSGWGRRAWPLVLFLTLVVAYLGGRFTGVLSERTVLSMVNTVADQDRLSSLETRLRSEDILLRRAKHRLVTGWGPWGAYRVGASGDNLVDETDGYWIIVLGKYGLVGLAAFLLLLLLPVLVAGRVRSRLGWGEPGIVVLTLGLMVMLFVVDSLLNAMPNPVYPLIAGAIPAAGGGARRPRSMHPDLPLSLRSA